MELVKDMKREPCNDCACKVGEHHEPGCDHERCPKCKGQLISCGCFVKFDEEEFAKYPQEKWSGIYFEEAMLLCEKENLYVYWGPGWITCNKDHPQARHDLNSAIVLMMTT